MLRVRDTCDGSQIPSQSRPTPVSPRVRGQASAVERGIHLPAASGEKVARSCRSIARSAAAWARLHLAASAPDQGDQGGRRGLVARTGSRPVRAGVPRQRRRCRRPGRADGRRPERSSASLSIGHRRKLLATIAAWGKKIALPGDPAGSRPDPCRRSPAAFPSRGSTEAERRQLTVMFCDLVGSQRAGQRDSIPRNCVRSSGPYAASPIGRPLQGARGAKYRGDGVMVYSVSRGARGRRRAGGGGRTCSG